MRRPLLRLFIVLLIELIGFGTAIPVLPFLTKDFGGDAAHLGLIFALMATGQFVMAPVWGALSDRFGRRSMMAVSLGAAAIASLLTAMSTSLLLLYVWRILAGVANGNVSIASAYVTDVTDASTRSKGMAVIGISFGVGFTIGPAIGAILATYGHALPFYVAAGISAFNTVLAAVLLRDTLTAAERKKRHEDRAGRLSIANIKKILTRPTTRVLLIVFFGFTIATTILEGAFAFFMLDVFGYGAKEVGIVLTITALVMVVVQGGMVGRLAKRFGDRNMAMAGLVVLGVGLVAATFWHQIIWVVVALSVGSVGRGLAHPGIMAMTANTSGDADSGKTMGLLQSSASLGRVFGPALGGVIYEFVNLDAPFIVAGVVLAITALYWRVNFGRFPSVLPGASAVVSVGPTTEPDPEVQ